MITAGGHTDTFLPGCHQGDAEVQLRGATSEDSEVVVSEQMIIIMPTLGWYEPPGHPDADAHEAVQGPEELLHSRVGGGVYPVHITVCILRFALFLFLVIKKLVSLISANAGLQVSYNLGTTEHEPVSLCCSFRLQRKLP